MKTQKEARKTDRRTIYTKEAIKDALLTLMEEKSFEKITVSDVCRTADINRGTYYLHYYELREVLDDILNDALSGANGLLGNLQVSGTCSSNECENSLCRMIRHSEKYRVVFSDETLTNQIVEKIAGIHKSEFVDEITARCKINAKQAEALFYFQINGCLAISKQGRELDCDNWISIRSTIDGFIAGGLERIISNT